MMNVNGITGGARVNQYGTEGKEKAFPSFADMLSGAAGQQRKTADEVEPEDYISPWEANGETFMEFCARLLEEKKQQMKEAAEFEAMMKAVDNMLNGKAAFDPVELLERLSGAAADEPESAKSEEETAEEDAAAIFDADPQTLKEKMTEGLL